MNPITRCLALTHINGFPFSGKELNYWRKCPPNGNLMNSRSGEVSQEGLFFRNKFPTAEQLQSKKLRQPQDQAEQSPGKVPLNGQGMASQVAQGMASQTAQGMVPLPLRKVCPSSGNPWPSSFTLTDAQQRWQARPLWHQHGSNRQKAGKECRGMDPSWVTSASSGSQILQGSKRICNTRANSSPEVCPQRPF